MHNISSDNPDVNEILEEIVHISNNLSSKPGKTVAEIEITVKELMDRSAQKLVETCASASASQQSEEPAECPQCQEVCRPIQKRSVNITTLCGKVRVPRWVYRCPKGHYHRPWDDRQKLKGKWTPRVAKRMCHVAAHYDYRAAAKELAYQGIEVSHTTLHQKVGEWTSDLRVSERVEKQTLVANERWYVSCDGCYTNSPYGWREVKVGCVYRDYAHLGTNEPSSVREESMRYVAGRYGAKCFGKELYALATHTGIYQEDKDTQEIVFIADGAAWIWNLCDEYFPNAVEIVDYMHAKSHLYNVAKVALGETQTDEIEAWVNEIEPFLFDGNIPEVVARICALDGQESETMQILEREANYFDRHAKRMQYKAFREKGYQIGSGVIESACKHVVQERCKQAAMRWTDEGINNILAIRCAQKNEGWKPYWEEQLLAA